MGTAAMTPGRRKNKRERAKSSASARARLKNRRNLRNLAHRLAKPALGRGRVQTQCLRALIGHGGTITTAIGAEWAYSKRVRRHDYRSVRRALASIGARKIGRASTGGRPIVWRLPWPSAK